jgi:hypothetical protein
MSKSMNFVTDTHALVWYFTDDLRLSKKASEAFEQTTDEGIIIVPSIVLAEIIFISKKGRITLTLFGRTKNTVPLGAFSPAPPALSNRVPSGCSSGIASAFGTGRFEKQKRSGQFQPRPPFHAREK